MLSSHTCCIPHPPLQAPVGYEDWHREYCLNNACELLFPFQDAIKRSDHILDVACGDGYITHWLSQKTPQGSVLGIDCDENQIEVGKGRYNYIPHLNFKNCDVTNIPINQKFNWITMFNSLHWISLEHTPHFLGLIKQLLLDRGVFIFTLGLRHEPIWSVIQNTATDLKWKQYFVNFNSPRIFFTETILLELIENAQLYVESLKIKPSVYVFENLEQFQYYILSGVAEVQQIPFDLQTAFLNDICSKYLKLCPETPNGNISLSFSHLEGIVHQSFNHVRSST